MVARLRGSARLRAAVVMNVSPLGRQPLNSSSTLSLRPGRPPVPARSRLIRTRAVGEMVHVDGGYHAVGA